MKKILAITIPILIIVFILCFMFFSSKKERTLKIEAGKDVYVTFAVDNNIYKKYNLNENDELTLPPEPNKEGCEFLYWEIDGKKLDKDITIDKDSTINAVFKELDNLSSKNKDEENIEENKENYADIKNEYKENDIEEQQVEQQEGQHQEQQEQQEEQEQQEQQREQQGQQGNNKEVLSIIISHSNISLNVGDTYSLNITTEPSDASAGSITWSSSNTSIATVNNGVVTAKASGTATITAKTSNGKTANCTVTVKDNVIKVQSISLSKTSVTLDAGKTTTLTANISPSNATNKTVEWSSSNTNVATVSNGKITAKSHGTATITAKTSDGKKKATCTVEVYENVDLVLMWGQSNMVGRAGKYSIETTTNNTSQLKHIDSDIVANNKSYSRVTVSLASNVAYEYKALTNSLVDISTNPLKFGEKIYYNNKSLSSSPETSDQAFLEESHGTNMVPYFAKEYYARTGHRLVIVHAASGGKTITSFFPESTLKLYPAIVKKYQMAETYLKQNKFIINNKFYVVYQGESDVRNGRAQAYESNYLKVHNKLISDLKLSFGAMVYMVRGDMAYEEYLPIVRNAQKKMVKENDNLIKGTDWPYSQIYDKNNTSILCPESNNVHLNAAALSQVGRQIAISVSNSNKIK